LFIALLELTDVRRKNRLANMECPSFFYVDERKPDGSSKGQAIDGPAHGEFVAELVGGVEGVPWHATFVAGEGYVRFSREKL
jgi:hypothetical protein